MTKLFGSVSGLETGKCSDPGRFGLSRAAFEGSVFFAELVAITLVAVATGVAYHLYMYDGAGDISRFASIGGLIGLAYGLNFLLQDEYDVDSLLEGRRTNGRVLSAWTLAFAALAVVGFLTKTTAMFSRGWLIIFFASGLTTVIALNTILYRRLGTLIERGFIRARRMMIIGTRAELAKLEREIADGSASASVGLRIVLDDSMGNDRAIDALLDGAVKNARLMNIEDVVIAGIGYRGGFIEKAIAAFNLLPVVLHLGAGGFVSRFKHARVARFGRMRTLSLTREPIGPFQALSKRMFDIAVASVALILLSPLLIAVAAIIKYDSAGPVFFRQRRRGYNLEEFPIWKFRTMTTMEDGAVVRQATQGDSRVTRVGRILRKYSIDELPQLINVLRGEMSIVGPRPHAVAHDKLFEKRIALYPRRLNVKPGITGWAQVNGFRGATETEESMAQRVDHDLYYIDNWSLLFDVYIVLLTAFSRKVYQNAY